ncbi:MAG: NAD(P)H-hydrate dehydratase [Candidatus Micrarchaeia archaeon]
MQSLKEFSIYTRSTIDSKYTYALLANAEAMGLSKLLLNENAGSNIAHELLHKHKNDSILVVCGCGGNGSIGISVARHLFEYVPSLDIALLCDGSEIKSNEARTNLEIMRKLTNIVEIKGDMEKLKAMVKKADVVIDAIIGVGLRGRADKNLSNAIRVINDYAHYIVSVDLPSGLNADTGLPNKVCINANLTYMLYKPKPLSVTRSYVKNSIILDLGLPFSSELLAGPGDVMLATEPIAFNANKYTHGSVLIVGGSADYPGAPLLAAHSSMNAIASLYSGSGYVTVAAPSGSLKNEMVPPTLIVKEFGAREFSAEDIPRIADIRHDVAVIGPGLASTSKGFESIMKFIKSELARKKGVIIDAAAIKAISRNTSVLGKNCIVTPHDGEFKSLTGVNLKNAPLEKRIYAAIDFAKSYKCTIVLKGHETIITDGSLLKVNVAASPALATMGTGDVLSGIIASYFAAHNNAFESAVAGVYVHSLIGDELYKEKGVHITAEDVIAKIPSVLKRFDVII